MKILKNIIRTIHYSINQIIINNKKNIVILLCDVFRRVGIAFAFILFPQRIVKYLLVGQFQKGMVSALFFCFFILLNEIMLIYMNSKRKKIEVDIHVSINSKLSDAIMETEYEKIEKKSYLEQVDFAKRCIERNSVLGIYDNVIEVISGAISLTGIIYIISKLNFLLVIMIIIVVIISAVGEVFRLNHMYDRDRQGNDIERNLYYARNDLSSNRYAKDIRIWHLYHYVSEKVELYAKKLCDLWAETSIKSVKIVGWTYLANGIQYVVVYAFLAYMTWEHYLEINDFILYSSATIAFGDIIKGILNAFIVTGNEYKYIEGVINVIEEQKKRNEKDRKENIVFKSKIELIDIWFKYYGSEEYIFQNLNLVMEKNKTYSIVGRNGAGKTTLVKLILGLYKPEKGQILVDGINIENISRESYREIFSCVFQDYNMYGFSIQENIAFGQDNTEKIMDVINRVGLKDKITSLPEGVNTLLNREINDNATMLSGGQEQLLAIARALYKDSEVYILDEPTAALSPNSEFSLYQQFYKISKNKTLIFISHRLASCVLCDEIIVIDGGRISEKGKHEELIKKNGLYADMFKIQAEPYIER